MRRLLRLALGVVGALVAIAAVGLAWAHVAIRRERGPLPTAAAILALRDVDDAPVRVAYVNTASQPMPRSAVLDPSRDPDPTAPYVMSHPSFLLEWADHRLLLVDVGMTRDGALAFGRPIEWLGGAEPIVPHASVADALGAAAKRVRGVVFTHLHDDHTGGVAALCAVASPGVAAFMTPAQLERPNYTTRGGLRAVRNAACLVPTRLEGAPPLPLPGFPGVAVVHAGGHTPGTQVVFAWVGPPGARRGLAFVGDVVNAVDGLRRDVPKPFLYSLVMVPEDRERLAELRAWLRGLGDEAGLTLVPAHDERWLAAAGLAPW